MIYALTIAIKTGEKGEGVGWYILGTAKPSNDMNETGEHFDLPITGAEAEEIARAFGKVIPDQDDSFLPYEFVRKGTEKIQPIIEAELRKAEEASKRLPFLRQQLAGLTNPADN